MSLLNAMNMVNILLEEGDLPTKKQGWFQQIFQPLLDVLNQILPALLIIVGTAGAIYAIVMGIKFVRAEDAAAREEQKKRLINTVIGIVVTVLLMGLMYFVANKADWIFKWAKGNGESATTQIKAFLSLFY